MVQKRPPLLADESCGCVLLCCAVCVFLTVFSATTLELVPPGCAIFPKDVLPEWFAGEGTPRFYPWKQSRNLHVTSIRQCKPEEYMMIVVPYAESGGVQTLASGISSATEMLVEKSGSDAAIRTHLLFQLCVSVMCHQHEPRIAIEFVRNAFSEARREHVAMITFVDLGGRNPMRARSQLSGLLDQCIEIDEKVNDPEEKTRPRAFDFEKGVGSKIVGLLATSCVVPEHVVLLLHRPWTLNDRQMKMCGSLFDSGDHDVAYGLFRKLSRALEACPPRQAGFTKAFNRIFNLPEQKADLRSDIAKQHDDHMRWSDMTSTPVYLANVIRLDPARVITDFHAWLSALGTEMTDCGMLVPQFPLLGFLHAAPLTVNWCANRTMTMLIQALQVPRAFFPEDDGEPYKVSQLSTAFTITKQNFRFPEMLTQPVVLQLVKSDLVPMLVRLMYLRPTPEILSRPLIRAAFARMVEDTVSITRADPSGPFRAFFTPLLTIPERREYDTICQTLSLPHDIAIPNITDPLLETRLDLRALAGDNQDDRIYEGVVSRSGKPSLSTLKALQSVAVNMETVAGAGEVVLDTVEKLLSRMHMLCQMDVVDLRVKPPTALRACLQWIKSQRNAVTAHALTHIGEEPLDDASVVPPPVLQVPQCRGLGAIEAAALVMNEELVSQGVQYVAALVLAALYMVLGSNLPISNALHIAFLGPSTCGKSLATKVVQEVAIHRTAECMSTSTMGPHHGDDTNAGCIHIHEELGHQQTGMPTFSRGQKLASDAASVASTVWLQVLESGSVSRKRSEPDPRKGLVCKRVTSSSRFACVFTSNMLSLPEAWRKRVLALFLTRRSLDLSRQFHGVSPEFVAIFRMLQSRANIDCQLQMVNALPSVDDTLTKIVLSTYKARLVRCMDDQAADQEPTAAEAENPDGIDDSVVGATWRPGQRVSNENKTEKPEGDDDLTRDIELIMSSRHVTALTAHISLLVTMSRWLFLTGPLKEIFGRAPVHELHTVASFFSVTTVGEAISLLVLLMPHSFTDICNPSPLIDEAILRHIVTFGVKALGMERILRWRVKNDVGLDCGAGAGAGAGAERPRSAHYSLPMDTVFDVTAEAKFFGAVGVPKKLPTFSEIADAITSGADALPPSVTNVLQHTPVSILSEDYRPMLVLCIEIYHACAPALAHASNSGKRMSKTVLVTLLARCLQKTMEVLATKVALAQDPDSPEARTLPTLRFYPLAPDRTTVTAPFMIPPKVFSPVTLDTLYTDLLARLDVRQPPACQSISLDVLTDEERVERLISVPRVPLQGPTFAADSRVRKTTNQLLAPLITATKSICTGNGVKLSGTVIKRHWRLALNSGLDIDKTTGECKLVLTPDESVHLSTMAIRQTVEILENQDNCLQPPGETQHFLMPPNESQAFGSHGITCRRRPNSVCRIPPEFCTMLKTHSSVRMPTEQGVRESHALVGGPNDNVLDMLYLLRGVVELPVELTATRCIRQHVEAWWELKGNQLSNMTVEECTKLVINGLKYPWQQADVYEQLFGKEGTVPAFGARFVRPIHPTRDIGVDTRKLHRQTKRKRDVLRSYYNEPDSRRPHGSTFNSIAMQRAKHTAEMAARVLETGAAAQAARRDDGREVYHTDHTTDYVEALERANQLIAIERVNRLNEDEEDEMPHMEPVPRHAFPPSPPRVSAAEQKVPVGEVNFQDFFDQECLTNTQQQCADPGEEEMELAEEMYGDADCLEVGQEPEEMDLAEEMYGDVGCIEVDQEPEFQCSAAEELLDQL